MSGTAKRSDTEQQTLKVMPSAIPVTHVTMLGISIAGILQAGGTWPPVGTIQRTASVTQHHNALPAICMTKDGNGISVKGLTALSPEKLKLLCKRQHARESMEWKSLGHCLTATSPNLSDSLHRSLRSLSDQQREERIHYLRNNKHELLRDKVKSYSRKLLNVTNELYILTGHHGYKRE